MKSPTEEQRKVPALGKAGEMKVKDWLIERGFTVDEWFSKAHAGHYDIKARKGKEKWIIEVKTGKSPSINVPNLIKMIDEKGFDKIGLAIATQDNVFLLEIKKAKISALKAWKKRKMQA